jgi:hypothetical protein
MSILTPLIPARHRGEEPPTSTPSAPVIPPEWHVGLSPKGMFPHHEANCACAKAACGLVIPRPEVFCAVHQGAHEFVQMHVASDCGYPRTNWMPRHRGRKRT